MSAAAFRQLLESGDVPGLMAAWGEFFPGMPQPTDYRAAEISMHLARTAAESVAFATRAWSHRWLVERDLPSQLPDHLKPRAEQMRPEVRSAVGISVNTTSPLLKPALREVQAAMENAVLDAYAERQTDPTFVKARMAEARDKTLRVLLGR